MDDETRSWEIGVAYNQDSWFADRLTALLKSRSSYMTGRNQPYSPVHRVDCARRIHAEVRNISLPTTEVSSDLIDNEAGHSALAQVLKQALGSARDDRRDAQQRNSYPDLLSADRADRRST